MTFDFWSFVIGLMVGTPFGIIVSALLLANGPDDAPVTAPTSYPDPLDEP